MRSKVMDISVWTGNFWKTSGKVSVQSEHFEVINYVRFNVDVALEYCKLINITTRLRKNVCAKIPCNYLCPHFNTFNYFCDTG